MFTEVPVSTMARICLPPIFRGRIRGVGGDILNDHGQMTGPSVSLALEEMEQLGCTPAKLATPLDLQASLQVAVSVVAAMLGRGIIILKQMCSG